MSDAPATAPHGAYGLTLPDLPGQQWLMPAPSIWPRWCIRQQRGGAAEPQLISDELALLATGPNSHARIDRNAAMTTMVAPRPHPDAAFVHPLLSFTALMHAEWNRRLAFHAGCFLAAGGAWGLLGPRHHGKSSTLGWLIAHGVPVIGDDTLITDGARVFAGPRCIDLREDAAEHFGLGRELGLLGTRTRFRVDVPPVAPEIELSGWVALSWGDEPRIERRPSEETLPRLAEHRALHVLQQHPFAWLEASVKPLFVLSRPRSWTALDGAMTRLLRYLENEPPRVLTSRRTPSAEASSPEARSHHS